MAELDFYFDCVLQLVKDAGEIIKEKNATKRKSVDTKSHSLDLVTETDRHVEEIIRGKLATRFPTHKFIGEESSSSSSTQGHHFQLLTDDPTWILDPIDGTMNFVHSFPHSCISIALFIEQQPQIALIYNPMLNQLFTAVKGKGAYINGERISVSARRKLSEALISFDFGCSSHPLSMKNAKENYDVLMPRTHGIRSIGSAALSIAMVACGAIDAFFSFGLCLWDIAAGELIVTEAGGIITGTDGRPMNRQSNRLKVLVTNSSEISKQMLEHIVDLDYIRERKRGPSPKGDPELPENLYCLICNLKINKNIYKIITHELVLAISLGYYDVVIVL